MNNLKWVVLALLAGTALASAQEKPVVPSFVEETAKAGISTVYQGEWQYTVGGGTAAFDCNNDGFDDLFIAGGEKRAGFYRNVSKSGGTLRFQRRNSGLEFKGVTGAYPLDIDADGIKDIVVLRVGENLVMRGRGNCRFERANKPWGFDGGDGWSTAFSATWERDSSWPTLAIGNYVDRREETSPWGSCTDNWLHRPDAAAKKFAAPLPLKPSFCTLSILFTDWNKSGTPSLRISNDREYYEGGQEQMWKIEPGQPPSLYTEAEGWRYLRIWGMGIAGADLDADGYPEYFLTSMADNKLQVLAEIPPDGKVKPSYADVAFKKGVTAHRPYMGADLKPSTAWHTQFEDVNNDGLADIFIAKGNVAKMKDFAMADPNNLLLQKADGTFMESGEQAGIGSTMVARGAALADFNLDGRMDIVVVNRWTPVQVWRNTGEGLGHWLQLKLKQDGPNRDGIGAWIEVRAGGKLQRREITSGGGHVSGQNNWWHFGLGEVRDAEVRVLWPYQPRGEWQKLSADGFYVIEPGKQPVAWKARR
jgi:enediyne biosynthesis protein E4